MNAQTYQAEVRLAQALIAAIPTIHRQDVTVGDPCGEPDHAACQGVVMVLLSAEEANQLTALIQQAGGAAGGTCLVCGCPLADLHCGHTCCCSGSRR